MAHEYHVAQANFARMIAPLDDPMMAEFVAQLGPVNELAEAHRGFVWRLQDEDGAATSIRAFEDPRILFNMSVWQTIDELFAYAYKSHHVAVFRDRARWFEPTGVPSSVLWWVSAGHQPSVDEARERLELLKANGPTPQAFTFKTRFDAPVSAHVKD